MRLAAILWLAVFVGCPLGAISEVALAVAVAIGTPVRAGKERVRAGRPGRNSASSRTVGRTSFAVLECGHSVPLLPHECGMLCDCTRSPDTSADFLLVPGSKFIAALYPRRLCVSQTDSFLRWQLRYISIIKIKIE